MSWWKDLPEDLSLVIANMSFNLGITRLMKFDGTLHTNKTHTKNSVKLFHLNELGKRATLKAKGK